MPINYQEYDLKRLRKDNNLSQQDLSDILEVSRSRLSRIENYKERLSYEQLLNLKEHFEEIESYEKTDEPSDNQQSALIQHLKEQIESLKKIINLKKDLIDSKNEQIALLKSQLKAHETQNSIAPQAHPIQNISYTSLNNKGKLINWNLIDIPSDEYIEIKPGLYDRTMTDENDYKEDWERIFEPALRGVDYTKHLVILNRSQKDSIFDLHYHLQPETIMCIEGSITETVSRTTLTAGDLIHFESMEKHEIVCHSDAKMVILIERSF